ncbi:MAG: PLP-dependent aminotransferase family protein [Candidatus Obscuribacterales bacterium]|nr:PLP-dependent aminotransferase family protein [Candidatus Obscuribacterales bacterium]
MKVTNDSQETLSARLFAEKLALKLDAELDVALYRQLSEQLRQAIIALKLMPGELLPSTRDLAVALNVSRKTVFRCYEDLQSQGYLKTEAGLGTFVSSAGFAAPKASGEKISAHKLTQYAQSLLDWPDELSHQGDHPELHFGAPPVSELPLAAWRQVMLKQLRNTEITQFYYDTEAFGYPPLRQALASYLLRSRALHCDPEQLIVFSHALSPLRLFAKMVVEQGDAVAIENPGFPFARQVFASQGAKIIPINVDAQGLCVQELKTLKEPIKLVYVTPSHQDPCGVMMSLERRKELLSWAKSNNCIVLEDDYDCEFRYTGSSLPALMALDENESVVYLGDMWKTLFPLVNVGYLVLPKRLTEVFRKAQSLSWAKASTSLPFFDQLALTEFMNEGLFERHLRKTRANYASRYRNLILGLSTYFAERVEYAKESGSMQLLIKFKQPLDDQHVKTTANAAGLAVISTEDYYYDDFVENEYLLAFVMLDEAEMSRRLKHWAALLYV